MGGAITAVILGLAAQQTVGTLIAGTVLLSARPFRVGDRIRAHAGGVAGTVEWSRTTWSWSAAVVPLREPDGVDLRARLDAEISPSDVDRLLRQAVTVETRADPELADEVVAALDQVSNARHDG